MRGEITQIIRGIGWQRFERSLQTDGGWRGREIKKTILVNIDEEVGILKKKIIKKNTVNIIDDFSWEFVYYGNCHITYRRGGYVFKQNFNKKNISWLETWL